MFGLLLESRARRQRRTGGAALSVAAHIALIGAATAATVHGNSAVKEKPKPELIYFTPAPAPKVVELRRSTQTIQDNVPRPVLSNVVTIDLVPPTVTPPSLPEINAGSAPTPDVFTVNRGGARTGGGGKNPFDSPEGGSGNEWRGTEVLMHITTSGKPRYPETLRQAGVDGSVLVAFSVDTLGKVDMSSVRIVRSTHSLFTDAVRAALPSFRFKPAEVNGKRVAALAEMPFEFQVRP